MVTLSPLEEQLLSLSKGGTATFADAAIIPVTAVRGGNPDYYRELLKQRAAKAKSEAQLNAALNADDLLFKLFTWVTSNFRYETEGDSPFALPSVLESSAGNCTGLTQLFMALAEQLGVRLDTAFATSKGLELHTLAMSGSRMIDLTNRDDFNVRPGEYESVMRQTTADVIALTYREMSLPRFAGSPSINNGLLERGLLFSPNHPVLLLTGARGKVSEESLETISSVTNINPDLAYAAYEKACMLYMLGRHEEALVLFGGLRSSHPEARYVHYFIAQTLNNMGRFEEGSAALLDYIRLAQNADPDTYLQLSGVELKLGKTTEAVKSSRTAADKASSLAGMESLPNDTRAAYRLIASNAETNFATGFLSLLPDNPNRHYEYNIFGAATRALRLFPDNPRALYLLGVADTYMHSMSVEGVAALRRVVDLGSEALNPKYSISYVGTDSILHTDRKPLNIMPSDLDAARNFLGKNNRAMATA